METIWTGFDEVSFVMYKIKEQNDTKQSGLEIARTNSNSRYSLEMRFSTKCCNICTLFSQICVCLKITSFFDWCVFKSMIDRYLLLLFLSLIFWHGIWRIKVQNSNYVSYYWSVFFVIQEGDLVRGVYLVE